MCGGTQYGWSSGDNKISSRVAGSSILMGKTITLQNVQTRLTQDIFIFLLQFDGNQNSPVLDENREKATRKGYIWNWFLPFCLWLTYSVYYSYWSLAMYVASQTPAANKNIKTRLEMFQNRLIWRTLLQTVYYILMCISCILSFCRYHKTVRNGWIYLTQRENAALPKSTFWWQQQDQKFDSGDFLLPT